MIDLVEAVLMNERVFRRLAIHRRGRRTSQLALACQTSTNTAEPCYWRPRYHSQSLSATSSLLYLHFALFIFFIPGSQSRWVAET